MHWDRCVCWVWWMWWYGSATTVFCTVQHTCLPVGWVVYLTSSTVKCITAWAVLADDDRANLTVIMEINADHPYLIGCMRPVHTDAVMKPSITGTTVRPAQPQHSCFAHSCMSMLIANQYFTTTVGAGCVGERCHSVSSG